MFKGRNDFKVKDILLRNTTLSLVLNNFKAYTESAGYNKDEVEEYSTAIYQVNIKSGSSFCINERDCVDYAYGYC